MNLERRSAEFTLFEARMTDDRHRDCTVVMVMLHVVVPCDRLHNLCYAIIKPTPMPLPALRLDVYPQPSTSSIPAYAE